MWKRMSVVAAVLVLGLAGAAGARGAEGSKESDPAAGGKVLEALRPSVVKVEYTLQFDKGEMPRGSGFSERCPSCGRFHGDGAQEYVQEERPLAVAGFLVGPTRVLSADPLMHPRFIKSVAVRSGDAVVEAKVAGYVRDQAGVWLELARPLPKATPLAFDGGRKGPYQALCYTRGSGDWTLSLQSVGGGPSVTEGGRNFVTAPDRSVIVDEGGVPVGMTLRGELPVDGSWKGSPAKWASLTAEEHAKLLETVARRASEGIVRVTLNFRSPKEQESELRLGHGREENVAVQHVLGVLTSDRTVLVLADLRPAVTARLERVRVYGADGKAVEAKFDGTMKDYGAFQVKTEAALAGALAISAEPVPGLRDRLLPAAEISLQGEKRVAWQHHARLAGGVTGWQGKIYPELAGESRNAFLFDENGALVAFPVSRREKVAVADRYSSERVLLTAAAQVRGALDMARSWSDPNNVPLSEQEENRLAWMGVELQPLTQELARANNVSDQTQDGESGALVTYVYPDSPAAKAGIEAGCVLLRLHAAGQPKPLDVRMEDSMFDRGSFPWEELGNAPEAVFDRIPSPWPGVENTFTRTLTDLGFGTKYTAEFAKDGKIISKEFEVVASPTHWGSAAKAKNGALGLTVREMTYEVRRYFQKKAEEPGVVISKIEMGSKASVAGLKPYEIITHVNDQPVKSPADFEKLTANGPELRLNVKRMTRGRIVKIRMTNGNGATTGPATQASEEGE